jgi:hypothetical protein
MLLQWRLRPSKVAVNDLAPMGIAVVVGGEVMIDVSRKCGFHVDLQACKKRGRFANIAGNGIALPSDRRSLLQFSS